MRQIVFSTFLFVSFSTFAVNDLKGAISAQASNVIATASQSFSPISYKIFS